MYKIKWYFFGSTYTLGEYETKEEAERQLKIVKETKKGAWIEEENNNK